ncbi:hypothetical protein GCM10027436_26090 [Actinophytocola sediminis]
MAVATLLLVAGCGTQVDTAKVTYPRTTLPAGQAAPTEATGGTEPPVAKTNDPAFAPDKLRAINPCDLLDPEVLEEVGAPAEEPNHGGFDECANYMTDGKGNDLNITLTLGDAVGNAVDATENIGGLPAMEKTLDTGDACFVTVITSTSPNLGLVVQVGGSAEELCAAGRTVMTSVVERIRSDPPPYDLAKGSLIDLDPCTLFKADELTEPLGGEVEQQAYDLHQCSWSSPVVKLDVRLRLGYDPDASSDGATVDLGGGITGHQEKTISAAARCVLDWKHRSFAGDDAEIVSLTYEKRTAEEGDDPCAPATMMAKNLISTLPKA